MELFNLDKLITQFQSDMHSILKQLGSLKENQNLLRIQVQRLQDTINNHGIDPTNVIVDELDDHFTMNLLRELDKE